MRLSRPFFLGPGDHFCGDYGKNASEKKHLSRQVKFVTLCAMQCDAQCTHAYIQLTRYEFPVSDIIVLVLEGSWSKYDGIPFVACTTDRNLFFFVIGCFKNMFCSSPIVF